MTEGSILVQVVPAVEVGREIGWGAPSVAEELDRRLVDIRHAIVSGVTAVAESLPFLAQAHGWRLSEVSATFGVTLTAEAGVLLTKASAGATFDVSVKFQREDKTDGGDGADPR